MSPQHRLPRLLQSVRIACTEAWQKGRFISDRFTDLMDLPREVVAIITYLCRRLGKNFTDPTVNNGNFISCE